MGEAEKQSGRLVGGQWRVKDLSYCSKKWPRGQAGIGSQLSDLDKLLILFQLQVFFFNVKTKDSAVCIRVDMYIVASMQHASNDCVLK